MKARHLRDAAYYQGQGRRYPDMPGWKLAAELTGNLPDSVSEEDGEREYRFALREVRRGQRERRAVDRAIEDCAWLGRARG